MQSNVDLCPRCSRSNSYRPPLLRLPIPRAALYFTRAHQPNKYYVFPLYPTRVPDQITRRILQTLDARSRNSAARDHVSEVGRFHMERLQVFYCGEGISEESLLATVALFLRNVSYSDIAPRVENRIVK